MDPAGEWPLAQAGETTEVEGPAQAWEPSAHGAEHQRWQVLAGHPLPGAGMRIKQSITGGTLDRAWHGVGNQQYSVTYLLICPCDSNKISSTPFPHFLKYTFLLIH